MKKIPRAKPVALLIISCGLIVTTYIKLMPSKAVRALPVNALNIQEQEEADGQTDRRTLVKARVPLTELAAYAERMGVPAQSDSPKQSPSWSNGPDWWKPSGQPRYVSEGDTYRTMIGWEDGYLYYDNTAWH
ncbi:hypothetical protein SAMN02745181_0563 [Rubritalea squalenifaciens DSM 18772]|uniref:Uncharacterized protein n=1 Tax=Rubritalea squalenifaciens DSM 18772 TaxID=1123071 RepID=A0A1M6CTX4_9BACT|nr:hypothetical protein [Rubritalea squalenifaciens]SHI64343.1 hypothetical protein SAMN02745181_0563 [Rubritalea squalenifaciens DSM 18772]